MFVLFDFIDAQNKRRRFFSYSSYSSPTGLAQVWRSTYYGACK